MKASYLIHAEYYLRRKNRFYFRDPDTKKRTVTIDPVGDGIREVNILLIKGRLYTLTIEADCR